MSLDSLAWRPNSPVWDAVRAEGSLPGVQEVSFPSQLEGDGYAPPATTVLSPMMNPALRRVAGGALTPVHRGTNVMHTSTICTGIYSVQVSWSVQCRMTSQTYHDTILTCTHMYILSSSRCALHQAFRCVT